MSLELTVGFKRREKLVDEYAKAYIDYHNAVVAEKKSLDEVGKARDYRRFRAGKKWRQADKDLEEKRAIFEQACTLVKELSEKRDLALIGLNRFFIVCSKLGIKIKNE